MVSRLGAVDPGSGRLSRDQHPAVRDVLPILGEHDPHRRRQPLHESPGPDFPGCVDPDRRHSFHCEPNP